jgi:hypothetical protein
MHTSLCVGHGRRDIYQLDIPHQIKAMRVLEYDFKNQVDERCFQQPKSIVRDSCSSEDEGDCLPACSLVQGEKKGKPKTDCPIHLQSLDSFATVPT